VGKGGLSRIGRVKMRNKTFQHSAECENVILNSEVKKKTKQKNKKWEINCGKLTFGKN
jgi:hypothetical protein